MGFVHLGLLLLFLKVRIKLIREAIFVKKKLIKKNIFTWLFQKKSMFLIISNL
jgi:hypothetical protein